MIGKLRTAVLGTIALGLLAWLFVAAQPLDYGRPSSVTSRLRELRTIEVEWAVTLHERGGNPGSSNAGMIAILDRLMCALADLERLPAWREMSSDPQIDATVEQYRKLLDHQRDEAMELLALRARTCVAMQEIASVLLSKDEISRVVEPRETEILTRALSAMILRDASSDAQVRADAVRTLNDLRAGSSIRDESQRELLARLLSAARTLITLEPQMDRLLSEMCADPLRDRSSTIMSACESWILAEQARRDRYQKLLYLYAFALLLMVFHDIHSREALVRQLAQVRDSLEERVKRRTDQLVRKNDQLATEIRDRQDAEVELEKARKAAEAASRTKSEFLANMSHEIRTPMTSILGYAERLGDEDLSDGDKLDAVETIQRNGQYLLQLINDILDLSKIEAGMLELERIPCSPAHVVLDVQHVMEARAHAKGLAFQLEFPPVMPETAMTDPVRLKQVLLNLVGNAIKFTEEGSITLRVEYSPAATPHRIAFAVRDTGIGLDEAQAKKLFRPFTQADSSTTRRFGGTGLGLSICKTIVEQMGGTIGVESEPGQGSEFRFEIDAGLHAGSTLVGPEEILRLRERREADRLRQNGVHIEGRVLLAEDGEDNQRLLTHYLRKSGAEVVHARDGHEAVELALAAQAEDRPFDVVVMDMQMPRLDGYGATSRLRGAGYRLPIIALTANAMAHDRQRCLDAGCDDFSTKPVDKLRFLSAIARWSGRTRRAADEREQSARAAALLSRTAFRAAGSSTTVPVSTAALTVSPTGPAPQDDDPELAALVRLFVDDLAREVERLTQALEAGDLEELAFAAHQLKGSAGSYGFPELGRQANRLEQCAKGELDGSHVEIELESFARLCRELQSVGR